MDKFISEDELGTFEGWLKYQMIDPSSPEELQTWRDVYELRDRSASARVGLMKLKQIPGEYRYAVAVRDEGLWLVLWVRRSRKGEYFVLLPRTERSWDVHTSYHLDGTFHLKSDGQRAFSRDLKLQPLTPNFRGAENLAGFSGYGPKSIGAVCDPAAFDGIVEVPPGILGPRHGHITVDLLEPNYEPRPFPWKEIARRAVFCDVVPWVLITVGSLG